MAPKLKRIIEDDQVLAPGTDALFGPPPSPEFSRLKHGFREVRLDAIRPNPKQVRTVFDEGAIASLAASINRVGLQSPVIVRPEAGGGYLLVAGERRLRACQLLGRATIPVFVSTGDVDEVALIENVQRVDLDAVDLAHGLQKLATERDYTQDQLGAVVGLKQDAVAKVLGILRLPGFVLEEFHGVAAKVSRSALEEFAVLAETIDEQTIRRLWAQIKAGELGRAGVREEARAAKETRVAQETGAGSVAPDGHALRAIGKTLRSFGKGIDDLRAHRALLADEHKQRLLALKADIEDLLAQ